MTGLNRLRGEAKFQAQLGSDPSFAAELWQPLTRSETWFVAPWIESLRTSRDVFVEGDLLGEYRLFLLRGGLDLGLQLGKYGEVRLGVTRGSGEAKRHKGPTSIPDLDFDYGGFRLRVFLDQMDDANFPQEGYWSVAELVSARQSLGSDTTYDRLEIGFGVATSHRKNSVLFYGRAFSALGSDLPPHDRFAVGGLFDLSGYSPQALGGQYGGSAGIGYFYLS
jgi:NTE family protein